MGSVIELADVHKHFGSKRALQGLSLNVRSGSIYGLIGPNGAGKSTTLNVIMGLLTADSGHISLFGKPWSREALRHVGAMINGPSYFPHLSGRKNLRVHACLLGVGKSAIDEALELAGAEAFADQKARTYSTGMKSRLAIAMALLADPPLLLLDEPQNGLDPAGVRELRLLMEGLRSEGRTVLFSSHILTEVSHVADDIGVIVNGRTVFQGTRSEFAPSGDLETSYFNYCQMGAER